MNAEAMCHIGKRTSTPVEVRLLAEAELPSETTRVRRREAEELSQSSRVRSVDAPGKRKQIVELGSTGGPTNSEIAYEEGQACDRLRRMRVRFDERLHVHRGALPIQRP